MFECRYLNTSNIGMFKHRQPSLEQALLTYRYDYTLPQYGRVSINVLTKKRANQIKGWTKKKKKKKNKEGNEGTKQKEKRKVLTVAIVSSSTSFSGSAQSTLSISWPRRTTRPGTSFRLKNMQVIHN